MNRPTAEQVGELRQMIVEGHGEWLDEEEVVALCDDWLAQEAVVEAAREARRILSIDASAEAADGAWLVLGDSLARLDAAGAIPTPQEANDE